MKNKKVALYLRVSKSDESQDVVNQKEPLLKFADSLGFDVVKIYQDYASGGSANRPEFQKMLKDASNASKREFNIILIWSLDRFSREGIGSTLSYLELLKRSGVALKSLQESWLDTSTKGMSELLLAIFSWVAEQERIRISARTKAGLAIAVKNGAKLGRPAGSKDKGRRRKSGYYIRWQNERAKVLV